MAKGNKRKGRRKQGDSSSDDGDNEADAGAEQEAETTTTTTTTTNNMKDNMDFAHRREMQRQAAADKRRAKQRCHVCGETGHVRRECPGIADGGRGASKFTKSKGDPGATHLKKQAAATAATGTTSSTSTSGTNTKGAKNRGRKPRKNSESEEAVQFFPELPAGFSSIQEDITTTGEGGGGDATAEGSSSPAAPPSESSEEPFQYYDASCDIAATIEYLRFGRGGAKNNKLSTKEAVALYQTAIETTSASSNYGGCICRSILKPGRPWISPSPLENRSDEWFVVGMGRDFLYNDMESDDDAAVACLMETLQSGNDDKERTCIVGFYADLDYSPETLSRPGCDRESQLRRLVCTCRAAGEANVAIQIRTAPGVSSTVKNSGNVDDDGTCPYDAVMMDLTQVLTETTAKHPLLKVHLSCWSGGADRMISLLKQFPDNLFLGLDATLSFAKASHMHECAFDVPLDKIVLETGANCSIPSVVAKAMGRDAFSHSGLVPFVADALATIKGNGTTTAEQVARAATQNTLKLYPQVGAAGSCEE